MFFGVLRILILALMIAVMARAVLSWFPPKGIVAKVQKLLAKMTDPVMRPLRRVVPPVGIRAFKLDLVPAIVLVVGQLVLLPALS